MLNPVPRVSRREVTQRRAGPPMQLNKVSRPPRGKFVFCIYNRLEQEVVSMREQHLPVKLHVAEQFPSEALCPSSSAFNFHL